MHLRHQRGYLRCAKRKNGQAVWEFLWRQNGANGRRLRRTAVIGTLEQYPTEDLALVAVNGLRVSSNEACNRQCERFILFGDLVDHYKQTELCDRGEWYSEATKVIYADFLKTWIRPHWAMINIRDVRTIAVENWLRELRRKDGNPLANTTKAKIRNLMSVLFNMPLDMSGWNRGRILSPLFVRAVLAKRLLRFWIRMRSRISYSTWMHLSGKWYCSMRRLVCVEANWLL